VDEKEDRRAVILHVANGHSTTALIESSGVPGRTMIWADPLNDGPVPGHVPDDELVRIRAAFLAGQPEEIDEVIADLSRWREDVDDQDRYDELVLWYEHDLFDQLNLIQLLAHLGSRTSSKPVSMVTIDSFAGHANFKGFGELSAQDLPGLFEARRPITPAQIALATRAWIAYRSADPRELEHFLDSDTSALPFLARALGRHLEEFPSDIDGLSRSERRMMDIAREAPADIQQAFRRMHEGETAYYITDISFFDVANGLATATPPLLIINLKHPKDSEMPVGTLELTTHGRDVLRGQADRVRLCGIDRWLGGVHLEGRGALWRWSGGERRLIEA
jgi:hypothetical protein